VTPTRRSSLASDRSRVMNAEVVPPHRPVVARDKLDGGPGPLFLSYWNVDLICGSCSFVLVAGAPSSVSLRDAVLVCPACDAPNETWDAHDRRATTPTSTSGCRGVDDALRDGVVRTLSPADSAPRMCASSVARATRCRT
jgi:hypothetical protein